MPTSNSQATTGPAGQLRFAIDTGGTFTDLIVGEADGSLTMHKSPTTPADPVSGVINVLKVAADARGETLKDYLGRGELLVHGTTHAINAIVTGRTARTAFLTTEGHPDTLVFREGGRQDAFNFTVPYPEPYVPKALTFEVKERITADGGVHTPLDEAHLAALLARLKALDVEAVAVCLLWSVVNPAHELAIGRLIEEHLPGVPYTLSHQINPSIREYRRSMSTCLDASLKPIMGAYMRSLDQRLRDVGFAGRLLIVTSQGGMMDAAQVAESPVHLINSGPSMAPVGAQAYCTTDTIDTLIVGDTGGTTFDVSLVRGGRIPRTRETWLGKPYLSHLTGMPSVDTRSIGAGGGSIAWVDDGGLLHVGPQSAGAVPGPAAYGRGGSKPTVTDAAVVLGYIDPDHFLGGRMKLDREAARAAVERDIARPLGQSVEVAAQAIMELATEHMVQAIFDITVNRGLDPANAAFVGGGGGAGLNCVAIGKRLGCRFVLVPETAAALAAAGSLVSDLVAHYQAMLHTTTDGFDFDAVNALLDRLRGQCEAFHRQTGAGTELIGIDWSVEARYPDQAWEIEVPLRTDRFASDADVQALRADFHRTHEETFAVSDENSEVEIVGWNAAVRCRITSQQRGSMRTQGTGTVGKGRPAYFKETGWIDTRVVSLDDLAGDAVIIGPAILESGFTSIVVDPGARVTRDAVGTLAIEIAGERA
ncbi:MAG TPA: hydantoinase/oxoprolinase family protein [Devosia sp.]|nr:hydantoinase/oxoprolinase family protein [Devosia sp.]